MPRPRPLAVLLLLALAPAARAGLYYSGEQFADLPSQWRGYLLDQRTLRNVAARGTSAALNSARQRYRDAAAKLEKAARSRKLTADEQADLGAVYVRLGEVGKAVDLLRAAQREHPHHFRIVANLGTAWQLQGDLGQAEACLQDAVRLAPGKLESAEKAHLKLVRLRRREPKDAQGLDDLFGVRFVGEGGKYEAGKLAAAERKKLPADALEVAQRLGLWLPADGRLLWQLGELAAAHGDVKTAAAILEGCVGEFGLRAPELRQHRQEMHAAAEALRQSGEKSVSSRLFQPRSARPLAGRIDQPPLPPVSATGVNALPWGVVTETTLDRQYRPTFAKYLKELDGKQVELSGFMQPIGDDTEIAAFMLIQYPVGCWYCEMPDITGIVYVELPEGKSEAYTRGLVRVTGKLKLNANDPENFLYTIRDAKVKEAE